MTDLISRLEAGRFEGDNAEVLRALGWTCGDPYNSYGNRLWTRPDGTYFGPHAPGAPLDSLDDALRLVPERHGIRMIHVGAMQNRDMRWSAVISTPSDLDALGGSYGATAAQALTIAVLRTHALLRAHEADHD